MIKKIVFLVILSIILSSVAFFVYKIIRYSKNYKTRQIDYDDYQSYFSMSHAVKILKKLDYKTSFKEYPYTKESVNVIFLLSELNKDNIAEWRKWLKKGRRLIVFQDDSKRTIFDHISFFYRDYHKNIKINSRDPVLEGVKNIFLDTRSEIDLKDTGIFSGGIEKILSYKNMGSSNKANIIRERINGGEIIFISDYSIFSNKSVLRNDNYILLNNLIKDYFDQTIVFDFVQKEPRLYSEEKNKYFLFMGNFKFLLIQLILLVILFFLAFTKRYGPSLDKEKFERRSLLNHLEAVGNYFEKAKNFSVFVKIFDRYFFHRLQGIIKIRMSAENNIIDEAKRRFNIKKEEEEIFSMNNTKRIGDIEFKREKFIRSLKGK